MKAIAEISSFQNQQAETAQKPCSMIQPKHTIRTSHDSHEKEADTIASKVVRNPEQSFIQRKCAHCEEEEKKVQRKPISGSITPFIQTKRESGIAVSNSISNRISNSQGNGGGMDAFTQSFMSSRFGKDFGQVKIHTDGEAIQMSRELNAKAFTVGNDIYFNEGQYQPQSDSGKHLLAHELTHTLQQTSEAIPKGIQKYSTEDCSKDQPKEIAAAYRVAKSMLSNAISRLTASTVTPETKKLFANHFGKYADWRRDIVVDMHYKDMQTILNDSEMTFECENECGTEKAYTYWIFGDVHLCPSFFGANVNEQAETIIHELFHLQGAFDLGYHGNNQDADTWWSVAVNNADAFSELAQDLFEQP